MHHPDILYVSMDQFPHLADLTNSSHVRNQATGESNLGNLGVTAHFACCSFYVISPPLGGKPSSLKVAIDSNVRGLIPLRLNVQNSGCLTFVNCSLLSPLNC